MNREDIIVRPETQADIGRTEQVVRDAFHPSDTHLLLRALRLSSAWRDLSFVAELDYSVVGHVCFTRGWLDAPSRLVEVLILSPMSVAPDHQRKGIGKKLVTDSLAVLSDRTEPLVFLEGNPAFYLHAGFVAATELGFTSPSVRIPERAFQVFPLSSYEPWMKGALVYPDVFWENDSVGLRRA